MSALPLEVHVRIGRLALGQGAMHLKATLGSCVGIALVWRERGLCALAHCLLPQAPLGADPRPASCLPDGSETSEGARYVDQAVQNLLARLGAGPGDRRQIRAHLAGGANMQRRVPAPGASRAIGDLNIEAAQRALASAGIEVASRDVGGFCARQIRVHCAAPEVAVTQVSAPAVP